MTFSFSFQRSGRGPARAIVACGWLFCGLLSSRLLALDPAHEITQYKRQTWNRQNGLPVNGVNSLAQTKDGYLWMGTSAGLVRFDGVNFKLVDLARVPHLRNSSVTSVAKGRDGGLWVGLHESSFGFYDGNAFTFRGKEAWGKLDMNVRSLFENPDGTLWLIAQRQASKLSRGGDYQEVFGTSADRETNVLCGYQDSRGRVWFGTASSGVAVWEAGKTTAFPDPSLQNVPVQAIVEDHEGQIWLGGALGLRCYDAQFRRKEIPPFTNRISALLVDHHGVLWIGTGGEGLVRYRSGEYTFLDPNDGRSGASVNALMEDREGSLWIAARDSVSQLSDIKFPTYRAAENPLIKDALSVSASRRGGVWIGSNAGLTYFDGRHKTYFTDGAVSNHSVKRSFEARNGDVYLVGGLNSRDLIVLSGDKLVAKYPAPEMLVGITEDAAGVVVSSGGKLFRVGPAGLTPYVFRGREPAMHWILNLLLGRDGAIWVASENGIFRVKDGDYTGWSAAQGLGGELVQGLSEDADGVIWGAMLKGIVRLKDKKIRVITHEDGLFDNNIYAVIPDDAGNLWVDSGRGIFRVSRQSMNDFADGKIAGVQSVAYDGPESVQATDKTFQERVGCRTIDGRIWFPNPLGVVVIDPAHVPVNPIAPPVRIDRVLVNGRERTLNETAAVAPGAGELEFHFAALSYIATQKIKFRYRLEGYDSNWVEAGDRRLAFYTNLKPGSYTFRVIAANADGVWNETGDSLRLRLQPHFYQASWFSVLVVGSICATLGGIYRWRVQRLNHRQRALRAARDALESEVRNRTTELAAANTSLQHEVGEHQRTVTELEQRTRSLETQIEERKKMQLEIERVHRELLEISRQAGMAEVATGVLHNVGNVLNSVNVSTSLLSDRLRQSRVSRVGKVSDLLREHEKDLPTFLASDPQGRQVPGFLQTLASHLATEQGEMLKELESLRQNIEHIKDIVAMQQNYAKVSGVVETVAVVDLVKDAVQMNAGALSRHAIKLVCDYEAKPVITVEKHKVLQILVNLLRNAKYACDESGRADKQMTVRVTEADGRVRIAVIDNGIGVPPANLARIFSHGFTTRKDGHGFGLHNGAIAARELGGSLTVHSEGEGKGAIFTLELPNGAEGKIG